MVGASNRAGARPDDHHLDFREFLSLELNGVEQGGCGDDCGPVLIVVHHGDVGCFRNAPLNLESTQGP